jgi:hypothetical protein
MARPTLVLRVASPCTMSWEHMAGDGRVRFCYGCEKNVFNVEALSDDELEALLRMPGDAPCLRVFRRADGHVLLGDCPVGAKSKRRRLRVLTGAAAAAATFAGACATYAAAQDHGVGPQGHQAIPMADSSHDLDTPDTQAPPPPTAPGGYPLLGAMVVERAAPTSEPKACGCLAGDPLCSCPDTADTAAPATLPFDRAAAVAALSQISDAVRRSVRPRDTSFHARIEFLPTGHVGTATLDDPGDVSDLERAQITKHLSSMRIPAFTGSPVTVGKSFEIHPKAP